MTIRKWNSETQATQNLVRGFAVKEVCILIRASTFLISPSVKGRRGPSVR